MTFTTWQQVVLYVTRCLTQLLRLLLEKKFGKNLSSHPGLKIMGTIFCSVLLALCNIVLFLVLSQDKATNPSNRQEDWEYIIGFCDQINKELEG